MEIHGLQKLTLLDFPGHTACTVFTGRCNFRCPFCQNASLVLHPETLAVIPEEDVFAFLEKRRGLLDGVAVTGGLIDYAAMDIKSSPAGYARCAGVPDKVLASVRESAALLEGSGVAHEFRTTAVKVLHTPEDFRAIGEWLAGTERYFIQSYADSGDILEPGMAAFSAEELEELLAAIRPFIPHAQLRGVD